MSGTDRHPGAPHLPWAELALAGVTTAVVYGFSRVFDTWSFFWPLVAVGAYAHLATMLLRRRGVGVTLSAVVTGGGAVLVVTWLWFASTTALLLPGPSTVDAWRVELDRAWDAFRELTAPVPALPGFLSISALALVFAVFLADWAAFRLWSPLEAVVPPTTLFVFCALLGAQRQRIPSAVLFSAAVLAFVLVHRVARLETRSGWLTTDVEPGGRALLRVGSALAALAVLGGVVVGPRLPGADAPALVDWRGSESAGGSRVTISPLVNIRERLVSQSGTEVFTVRSTDRAYWRLTALDTFDGQIWRSGGRYTTARGSLAGADPPGVASRPMVQTFEITGLESLWLPAAYRPIELGDTTGSVRFQEASSTLIVDTDYASSDGFRYTVTSAVPAFTADELRTATDDAVPDEIRERYAGDPEGLSDAARAWAAETVAGTSGPYERALALQARFRGPEFRYDLDPQPGHDGNAIDAFLARGSGYCEQFAGTFAVMARALGIPARVAVGFTWGEEEPQADGSTLFRVQGRHAHAWPEVYLAGFGWVAFEPTPDRGAPGMGAYNGVTEPAQDEGTEPTASTTTTAPTTTTTTDTGDPASAEDLAGLLSRGAATADDAGDPDGGPDRGLAVAATTVVALIVAYLVVVPGWKVLRRHRRRAAARDPRERVRLAWTESTEELALVGATPRPSETNEEFADRAGAVLPAQAEHLRELARTADAALYAADGVDHDTAAWAEATSGEVTDLVRSRVPIGRRALHRLDPRPLVRRSPRRPRRQAHGPGS